MPKRQKEKQYQSAREHRANQSLRSGTTAGGVGAGSRPLPFECCALTLTPFTTPVCTKDGIIFDNAAITPYLLKHKVDPVTGRKMNSRDLILLHMDRDESTGKWQCPVLNKAFTDRTKVVAIRQPGINNNEANVFSYEAYYELNVKAKNYLDLISGLKFTKEDVIVLQDPNDEAHCKLRDIQNFAHIHALREGNNTAAANNSNSNNNNIRNSVTASRIMDKLSREKRKREQAAAEESKKLFKSNSGDTSASSASKTQQVIYTDELITSVNLTSGKASGSFTSTSMDVTRDNSSRLATEDEIITSQCEQLKRLKKKGTVRMFTNMGAMDIEIHCDIVPRTAMNFMLLAEKGEYNGSKFHRSIPNFMIQGGKKAGGNGKRSDSNGGGSYWEKPFKDEFDNRLTHSGQGVVSMANSGPGTNGRQFFITYKSCAHLDRKHSVFGKVIRGLDILRRMEMTPTNKESDKPLETIKIESIEILDNPVNEALEAERRRIEKRKKEKQQLLNARKSPALGTNTSTASKYVDESAQTKSLSTEDKDVVAEESFTIGKYLKVTNLKKDSTKGKNQTKSGNLNTEEEQGVGISRLPPPPKKTSFGDFSGW